MKAGPSPTAGPAPYLQGSVFISQLSSKPLCKFSQAPPTISARARAAVVLNNSVPSDSSWIEGKAYSAKGGSKTWSSDRLEHLQKKPAGRCRKAKLHVLSHRRPQSNGDYQLQT